MGLATPAHGDSQRALNAARSLSNEPAQNANPAGPTHVYCVCSSRIRPQRRASRRLGAGERYAPAWADGYAQPDANLSHSDTLIVRIHTMHELCGRQSWRTERRTPR